MDRKREWNAQRTVRKREREIEPLALLPLPLPLLLSCSIAATLAPSSSTHTTSFFFCCHHSSLTRLSAATFLFHPIPFLLSSTYSFSSFANNFTLLTRLGPFHHQPGYTSKITLALDLWAPTRDCVNRSTHKHSRCKYRPKEFAGSKRKGKEKFEERERIG